MTLAQFIRDKVRQMRKAQQEPDVADIHDWTAEYQLKYSLTTKSNDR